MTALSGIAKLRAALWQIEQDLGLEKLTCAERDVLFAFHSLAATGHSAITSEDVRRSPEVRPLRAPRLCKAVLRLQDLGYLEPTPGQEGRRAWRITDLPHPAA